MEKHELSILCFLASLHFKSFLRGNLGNQSSNYYCGAAALGYIGFICQIVPTATPGRFFFFFTWEMKKY